MAGSQGCVASRSSRSSETRGPDPADPGSRRRPHPSRRESRLVSESQDRSLSAGAAPPRAQRAPRQAHPPQASGLTAPPHVVPPSGGPASSPRPSTFVPPPPLPSDCRPLTSGLRHSTFGVRHSTFPLPAPSFILPPNTEHRPPNTASPPDHRTPNTRFPLLQPPPPPATISLTTASRGDARLLSSSVPSLRHSSGQAVSPWLILSAQSAESADSAGRQPPGIPRRNARSVLDVCQRIEYNWQSIRRCERSEPRAPVGAPGGNAS